MTIPEDAVGSWVSGRGSAIGTLRAGISLHVSSENTAARYLYRALGFVVIDDRTTRGLVMFKETTL